MSQKQRRRLIALAIIVGLSILGSLFRLELPPIEAGPVEVFSLNVGGFHFPVSNSLIVTWVVILLLVGLSYAATRRVELVPSGLQNLMETALETIRGLVRDVAGERGTRFFPYVATIFLFVLFSNWLGLMPGFGSIYIEEEVHGHIEKVPLFRAPSADLNTTLALAVFSVVMTQIMGVMILGFVGYFFGRFFRFGNWVSFLLAIVGRRPRKRMIGYLLQGGVELFIGIVEFVSDSLKIVSFSFRLWGNIFAGEVLLMVAAFLFAQILPLPFYALEVFVGFIQAFVFAILTLIFMTIATMPHGEGHAAEASH